MHLLLLTVDLSDNSTGRAHVLWSLASTLGWTATIVAPKGRHLWEPLRGTDFADDCVLIADDPRGQVRLEAIAAESQLAIAVKPLPDSFGRAIRLKARTGIPVLLDIDDPDFESRLSVDDPLRALLKATLRPRAYWATRRLRRTAARVPVIVSNPVLQTRYGGVVVAHARADSGAGQAHTSRHPTVVFVGTNRQHKGLGVLRQAVAHLRGEGFRLVVTDSPPPDAKPWERWVGITSLHAGKELVRQADIVVLPSLPSATAAAQLPAKLVDAMIAGRAIAASRFEPVVWALDGAGCLFEPGSREGLIASLRQLADPEERQRLGALARDRALARFTVARVASDFRDACLRAAMPTAQMKPSSHAARAEWNGGRSGEPKQL